MNDTDVDLPTREEWEDLTEEEREARFSKLVRTMVEHLPDRGAEVLDAALDKDPPEFATMLGSDLECGIRVEDLEALFAMFRIYLTGRVLGHLVHKGKPCKALRLLTAVDLADEDEEGVAETRNPIFGGGLSITA